MDVFNTVLSKPSASVPGWLFFAWARPSALSVSVFQISGVKSSASGSFIGLPDYERILVLCGRQHSEGIIWRAVGQSQCEGLEDLSPLKCPQKVQSEMTRKRWDPRRECLYCGSDSSWGRSTDSCKRTERQKDKSVHLDKIVEISGLIGSSSSQREVGRIYLNIGLGTGLIWWNDLFWTAINLFNLHRAALFLYIQYQSKFGHTFPSHPSIWLVLYI